MKLENFKSTINPFQSFEELKQSPIYDLVKNEPLTKSGFFAWIYCDLLMPNTYNPNKVADPEMELLLISILEDGWTQPIVGIINLEYDHKRGVIVDGYHRWTTAQTERLLKKHHGFVPVVFLTEAKTTTDLMMATIRHNRARGTHGVLAMAEIVKRLILVDKVPMTEIMRRLQMEAEEVARLALQVGVPHTAIVKEHNYTNAFVPDDL